MRRFPELSAQYEIEELMELKTRVQSNVKERGGGGHSAIARLQLAMERHVALQDDASSILKPRSSTTKKKTAVASSSAVQKPEQAQQGQVQPVSSTKASKSATSSVAALAEQLQSLWYAPRDTDDPQTRRAIEEVTNDNDAAEDEDERRADDVSGLHHQRRQHGASAITSPSSPPPLVNALLKIGSHEKDELLVHLLQQVAFFRGQLSEVATLGETIAAQLVHQQHELRLKHREQMTSLEQQLHDAVHFHPRVLGLERKVEALEASNREKDQQLRFAVQKLQRSRQREKELKTMQDPLWDI